MATGSREPRDGSRGRRRADQSAHGAGAVQHGTNNTDGVITLFSAASSTLSLTRTGAGAIIGASDEGTPSSTSCQVRPFVFFDDVMAVADHDLFGSTS
jgi:hypothetical protein